MEMSLTGGFLLYYLHTLYEEQRLLHTVPSEPHHILVVNSKARDTAL